MCEHTLTAYDARYVGASSSYTTLPSAGVAPSGADPAGAGSAGAAFAGAPPASAASASQTASPALNGATSTEWTARCAAAACGSVNPPTITHHGSSASPSSGGSWKYVTKRTPRPSQCSISP